MMFSDDIQGLRSYSSVFSAAYQVVIKTENCEKKADNHPANALFPHIAATERQKRTQIAHQRYLSLPPPPI
jgi:hypothetical protein